MNAKRPAEFALLCATACAMLLTLATVVIDAAHGPNSLLTYGSQGLVYFAAGSFLVLRARSGNSNWAYIGAALFIMTVASASYQFAITVNVAGHEMDFGDAIWLAAYPLLIVGIARLSRQAAHASPLEWLDVALVSAAGFAVAARVIGGAIAGAARNQNTADITVNVVSVLLDLVMLAVVFGAVQRAKWRPEPAIWMLSLAAFCYAVFDSQYAVQIITDTYHWGGLFDIGWPLSALLFVISAWIYRAEEVPARESASTTYLIVPSLFTLIAGAVLVTSASGNFGVLARVFAGVAVVFAVARMYFSVAEATRLASQLRSARVDAETDLPNRRWLLDGSAGMAPGAVVVEFALDGLAEINADFGIHVGLGALRETTARIRAGIRSDDVLLRSGEERLAVLIRESSPALAAHIAEAAVRSIELPMQVDGYLLTVAATAGVSSQGDATTLPGDQLAEAAAALLEAQRLGSGTVHVFSGLTGERTQERLRMRSQLRAILRDGSTEVVPYFQPIVHVAGESVLAVEALARWHRDGRVLLPDAFLAELDDPESRRMLAVHSMRSGLQALRMHDIDVAMTLDVRPDIIDAAFEASVQSALQDSGSRPAQLILEVAQAGTVPNVDLLATTLRRLRAQGVRLLLDGFGSGGSALSDLRQYPVDGIKFDRSFSEGMWSEATTSTIVRGVTSVARSLDMFVVYEGVSDASLLSRFAEVECGYVQGSGIARPLPAQDLASWLRTHAASHS